MECVYQRDSEILGEHVGRRGFVAGIGAAGALAASGVASAATARAPDVIFIMADDLGYADLSCTGSHGIRTPAIDSLARDGAVLTQGYASSPNCSPTRTALLSGCYQGRFAVGLEEPLGPNAPAGIGLPKERPTFASVLRDRNYRTKLVGKWHLGDPPRHGPLQHGYDEFLGIVEGAADYFRHHLVVDGREVGRGLARGNGPIERAGYLTDLFGNEDASTIRKSRPDRPLMLSLHFNAPHWPWEGREDAAAARSLGSSFRYDGGSLATYKAMVEAMDANVAKVLAALHETGRAANALVIFTSDNGGERFSETWSFTGVKGELLEGGIRVPILIRWPSRIAAGSVSPQVMASIDFLPTCLAAAGGAPPAGRFDGLNLLPQLTGKAPAFERTLFWRYKANGQAAVRRGDWKYLRLGGKEHLFDLATDQRERAERGGAEPTRLAELKAAWARWSAGMLLYPTRSWSEQVKDHYPDRY